MEKKPRIKEAANYIAAFMMCLACTVLSWGNGDHRYLIMSDINVAIWLLVAWLFDFKRT